MAAPPPPLHHPPHPHPKSVVAGHPSLPPIALPIHLRPRPMAIEADHTRCQRKQRLLIRHKNTCRPLPPPPPPPPPPLPPPLPPPPPPPQADRARR